MIVKCAVIVILIQGVKQGIYAAGKAGDRKVRILACGSDEFRIFCNKIVDYRHPQSHIVFQLGFFQAYIAFISRKRRNGVID